MDTHTLEIKRFDVIKVTIKAGDIMWEIVKEYIEDGWTFDNHSFGIHPDLGDVTHLKFSKEL